MVGWTYSGSMSLARCRVEYVQMGPQHLSVPDLGRFRRNHVPDFAIEAYRRLVPAVNLRCVPNLVSLEHANGFGGFYVDGVIAFGLADLRELAEKIGTYFPTVGPREERRIRRFEAHRLITAHDRLAAATTALLAHELGHAVGAQWRVSKFGVAEEVQADEMAGQMAGTVCTRSELDRAFFHAVGCTSGVSCSHPDPDSRVRAYDRGRAISDRCVPLR
jgi:hypothetical protein